MEINSKNRHALGYERRGFLFRFLICSNKRATDQQRTVRSRPTYAFLGPTGDTDKLV